MRRAAVACLLLVLLLPGRGRAEAPSAADGTAIRGVISAQIEDLRRGDGGRAFALASPGIRAMFGTAGRFMDMVRRAYSPVVGPRSVQFGTLDEEDGVPVQRVELVAADGAPVTALYSMERETDGSWRVAGCRLLQPERLET